MVANSAIWTIADLAAMPDDGWKRYEIIDGDIHLELEPWSHRTNLEVKLFKLPAWSLVL